MRDIANQLVYIVNHIHGTALLYRLSVLVETETVVESGSPCILSMDDRQPLANGSTSVEALTDGPRQACLTGLPLHVTSRKVDANGNGVVITVGESFRNVFA